MRRFSALRYLDSFLEGINRRFKKSLPKVQLYAYSRPCQLIGDRSYCSSTASGNFSFSGCSKLAVRCWAIAAFYNSCLTYWISVGISTIWGVEATLANHYRYHRYLVFNASRNGRTVFSRFTPPSKRRKRLNVRTVVLGMYQFGIVYRVPSP